MNTNVWLDVSIGWVYEWWNGCIDVCANGTDWSYSVCIHIYIYMLDIQGPMHIYIHVWMYVWPLFLKFFFIFLL